MNLYLGNYIGEFLGETTLAAFFLLSGLSMLGEARFPKWLGWSGVGFSLLFFVGAFRNVTSAVQVVADINNGLLPLWMIVMGAALIWYSRWTTRSVRPNNTLQRRATEPLCGRPVMTRCSYLNEPLKVGDVYTA